MAVNFSQEGGIGHVTLDRPPANSYDSGFAEELGRAVEAAASDDEVKVVLVRSASERFFCAGADIKAFHESSHETNVEMVRRMHEILREVARVPKLFIAEIGGHALGGGLEIALACDLRFGAEGEYKLGLPEVTLGILPGNGGTQRLPRLIGASRALDLMITGRTLSPGEAKELGVLDRLFPADRLAEETRAYAEALTRGALRAIGSIKLAVHRGLDGGLDDGLERERLLIGELFESEDGREGVAAFSEKRQPEFKGR
jgi:enoyl-CoA hydratase/carnithine racemase